PVRPLCLRPPYTPLFRSVFIDPKMVELAAYKNLPHLACAVISDVRTQAKAVLERLVDEMESRYEMMLSLEARNIQEFNETIRTRDRKSTRLNSVTRSSRM